jgi:hypothetical protein
MEEGRVDMKECLPNKFLQGSQETTFALNLRLVQDGVCAGAFTNSARIESERPDSRIFVRWIESASHRSQIAVKES